MSHLGNTESRVTQGLAKQSLEGTVLTNIQPLVKLFHKTHSIILLHPPKQQSHYDLASWKAEHVEGTSWPNGLLGLVY